MGETRAGAGARCADPADDAGAPGPLAVVVLAAGSGRRLGEGDGQHPKWLTDVGGRSIADRQLAGLDSALDDACHAVVVGGHGVDRVRRWLGSRPTAFPLEVCVNDDYAGRNNWYSLLLGLDWLAERRWEGAAVVLNSDLCAEPRWFDAFLRHMRAERAEGAVLAVDLERPLTDEAMKDDVRQGPTGAPCCVSIGKTGVARPSGEYVGMAGFGRGSWVRLLDVLRSFRDRPELADAWYEAAIQVLMDREPVLAWAVPDSRWTEIDDQSDLAVARALMGRP